jgi:hypothetical protein
MPVRWDSTHNRRPRRLNFDSFGFGKPGFHVTDVLPQSFAAGIAVGRYRAKPSRVFQFEDIRESYPVIDANQAGGKMVVKV